MDKDLFLNSPALGLDSASLLHSLLNTHFSLQFCFGSNSQRSPPAAVHSPGREESKIPLRCAGRSTGCLCVTVRKESNTELHTVAASLCVSTLSPSLSLYLSLPPSYTHAVNLSLSHSLSLSPALSESSVIRSAVTRGDVIAVKLEGPDREGSPARRAAIG